MRRRIRSRPFGGSVMRMSGRDSGYPDFAARSSCSIVSRGSARIVKSCLISKSPLQKTNVGPFVPSPRGTTRRRRRTTPRIPAAAGCGTGKRATGVANAIAIASTRLYDPIRARKEISSMSCQEHTKGAAGLRLDHLAEILADRDKSVNWVIELIVRVS